MFITELLLKVKKCQYGVVKGDTVLKAIPKAIPKVIITHFFKQDVNDHLYTNTAINHF